MSARSVAEAEVMSARHDAEIASKQREDALLEASELRKRLEDQRDKSEEAAKASLTQVASSEAHVAKLDAQLSTATARNKTLEDEVETLERKGLELTKQRDEATARVEGTPRSGSATRARYGTMWKRLIAPASGRKR